MSPVPGPLAGLRVVELSGGLAPPTGIVGYGPAYAGKLFADAGADVWLVATDLLQAPNASHRGRFFLENEWPSLGATFVCHALAGVVRVANPHYSPRFAVENPQ